MNQKFSITYEITLTFFDFIVQHNDRSFVQPLIESFKNPFAYQLKIAILYQIMSFMSKRKMKDLMKYIEELLDEDPENTIVTTTINPVRVMMTLYDLVEIAETEFGFSNYISKLMKEKIIEQTITVLNSYDEPQSIIPLIENHDLMDKDCFWYLQQYEMFTVLDTKIFDLYVRSKWEGWIELNAHMFEWSTSY